MSGYVLTWDSVSSAGLSGLVVTKVRRRMVGAVRDQRMEVPGRDGDILYQERRGNRPIVAMCKVVSPLGERHDRVVAVADWLDRTGYRRLIVDDQPDRYWSAALAEDPDPDEWRHLGEFDIQWTAMPYAFAVDLSSLTVTGVLDGALQSFTPDDEVDAFPVIEITAHGGSMYGFRLEVNGDALNYSGTVADGATVTISSLNYTVYAGANTDTELTGAYVPGTVFPASVNGTFPIIIEGLNDWSLEWGSGASTATHATVTFTWRRRFR